MNVDLPAQSLGLSHLKHEQSATQRPSCQELDQQRGNQGYRQQNSAMAMVRGAIESGVRRWVAVAKAMVGAASGLAPGQGLG